jgi:hypothetical protein
VSEVGGVEGETEIGKRLQLRRVFGIVGGEHAGGCGGGLGEGITLIEYGDCGSSAVEFEGE